MRVPVNEVLLGDCLEVLRTFPDNVYDSVVCDPPYGLGTREPTVEEIIAYLQGEELDTGGDFMGKRWTVPSVGVWKEVFRVLKPGGYVLAFGGTRTFDLISLGLRAAGFEYRDTLQWLHGQGFPKSLNVSKAIDSAAGVDVQHPEYTAPVTDDAKKWSAYGTALKPAWEPILVFRKPLEGTVVDNVLKHGTGATNIDAARVRHASPEDFAKHKEMVDRIKEKGGSMADSWKNSSDLSGASDVKEGGRWPPNVVMSHAEGCEQVGMKKITHGGGAGQVKDMDSGATSGAIYGAYHKRSGVNYRASDGTETIEVWECVEGCPVKALDEQSGERPSTLTGRADPNEVHDNPGDNHGTSLFGGGNSQVYADSGGASRFFPQFEPDKPQGRWPTNVVMSHAEGCKRVGTKTVQPRPGSHGFKGGASAETYASRDLVYSAAGDKKTTSPIGEDGLEEVEAWDCVEGCPVKALDEQSGECGGTGGPGKVGTIGYHRGASGQEIDPNFYKDVGGASRFFPTFADPSFFYTGKATKAEATLDGEIENKHPTKKPLKLMAWLVKLVTQEDGIVLDPYCGSGSTLHAAVAEGMRFTGIDNWDYAHEVATKRMAIVCQRAAEEQGQHDLFDLAFGDDDD